MIACRRLAYFVRPGAETLLKFLRSSVLRGSVMAYAYVFIAVIGSVALLLHRFGEVSVGGVKPVFAVKPNSIGRLDE